MRPLLSIIDGNYFVNYSSHSAILDLKSPKGDPTGALHVFLNTLWNIKQKIQGDMIVVFDGGHAAFRTKLYPGYKKKEKIKPMEFQKEFELIKEKIREIQIDGKTGSKEINELFNSLDLDKEEIKNLKKNFEYYNREVMKDFTFTVLEKLLPIMGIPTFRILGEEADDIIYVLTKKLVNDYSVYCVTSDEDFVQMTELGATVLLYRQDLYITAGNFKSNYNFNLDRFTLYKAIKGDESDKIKGVPSVGKVNAAKIVNGIKEPTIEALLDFCSDSKDKKHKAVLDNLKIVKRNLKLMDFSYIEIDEEKVFEELNRAKKQAVIHFPLAKKLFHEFDLQVAGIKWLSELLKTK